MNPRDQCWGVGKCNNGDWLKKQTLTPMVEQSSIFNLNIGAM